MSTAIGPEPVILVVDDEPPIREIQRRLLGQAGFRVVEAAGAVEAFDALEQHGRIDLIVADLDMPGVSGDEMARRIRLVRPDLKVLSVTGHIDRLMDARPLWDAKRSSTNPSR